jgi:hypothetical protein
MFNCQESVAIADSVHGVTHSSHCVRNMNTKQGQCHVRRLVVVIVIECTLTISKRT